jgi:hypothetical protein
MTDGAAAELPKAGAAYAAVARRFPAWLQAPVDALWLGTFRVLFGATMFVSMVRFIAYGWIDSFFVAPSFHFKYWGFAFVQPLPSFWMHALFWLLALLSGALALGLFARVAASAFVLGFTYLSLIDVTTYLNHYYLAILLGGLLAASPAHRVLALSASWRPSQRVQEVPNFWLVLFRFQMAAVYTFAGLAKLHGDWLLHAHPLRIWLSSHTDMPVLGVLFQQDITPWLMSWIGFLFDTTIAWWLLYRPTRRVAYAAVIVFHVLTRMLFPIGMFPVIMIVGATLFFEPDWSRPWLARLSLIQTGSTVVRPSEVPSRRRLMVSSVSLAAAALFCLVQLAMPLRFLVYGGNVRWHEQGMRWSWRVMVREKNGSTTFRVTQKNTGRQWQVSPHRYLTRLQEREMASQPDLILQLAKHIRDDFARRGFGPVAVHADALVSLNGRPMSRLIDPDIDLAEISDGLKCATWILPSPEQPPPHLHAI